MEITGDLKRALFKGWGSWRNQAGLALKFHGRGWISLHIKTNVWRNFFTKEKIEKSGITLGELEAINIIIKDKRNNGTFVGWWEWSNKEREGRITEILSLIGQRRLGQGHRRKRLPLDRTGEECCPAVGLRKMNSWVTCIFWSKKVLLSPWGHHASSCNVQCLESRVL